MSFLDPKHLVDTFGLGGLLVVVFIESGIFPAPLPGDSLLFTAGLFAATNRFHLNIVAVAGGAFAVAVLGSQIGFVIGERFGPRLFKPGARFFKPEYEERSREFFDRQGPKAIILARFVPVVRTITPILAGVSEMRRRVFLAFNALGALIWATGVSLLGYFLGEHIHNVDRYILPIVAVIAIASLIPPYLEFRRQQKRKTADRR